MNKKTIIRLFSVVAVALMGIGCQADYFNETYLPGYENDGTITNVRDLEFTLTGDDYAAIAKNAMNKSLAEAEGEAAVEALAAIGKNKYFAAADEAALYVPAYINALYPTLDSNSTALVTYTMAVDVPTDVVFMNNATEYTLTEDDYKVIWGSEEDYANALTPKTMNKLAGALPVSDDARVGEYMVVTYNYSSEEPVVEVPETPENPDTPDTPEQPTYTSVLGSAAVDDVVEVNGYISAVSTQGPILTDASGSVLLYRTQDLAVGDEVTVSGTIDVYNNGLQIGTDGISIEKTGTTTVTYPEPMVIDGAKADELLTSHTGEGFTFCAQYAKMAGNVSVSTSSDGTKTYYNVAIPDATAATGSIYGITEELAAQLEDGKDCTLYGYFISISRSGGNPKFVNIVVVSINEAPASDVTNNYTSVLGTAAVDDVVEVNGYISAVSTQGPILTDASGSVLLYRTQDLAVGDEVTVSGTIDVYNNGLQIGTDGISIEKTGTTTVTYPEPMVIDGAKADELLTSHTGEGFTFCAQYAKMAGNVSVSTSSDGTKTYYNVAIPDATAATGSIYGITEELAAQLEDGKDCTLYGYFISISRSGGNPKFVNIVLTSVEPAAAPAAKKMALKVTSQKRYAYFKLGDSGKYQATDIVAIQPEDYTAMGQSYGSFTDPTQDTYIPLFLAETYPYAMADDKIYVGYRCYANKETTSRVDEYVFNGTWTKTEYFTSKTDQFRKTAGVWAIDPTLELDFTSTSSAETKAFYQYCVNWVYDNKDVPLGAPARDNEGEIISTEIVLINGAKPAGNYWVSNYGNNEFYTGASAYYGNMDWRPSAVKSGFAAAGMGELSDDEILAKLKEHTAEVFAEVLGYVYPEMTTDEYKKVIVKVYAYGPNKNYSLAFDVVEKGKFKYVADSLMEL